MRALFDTNVLGLLYMTRQVIAVDRGGRTAIHSRTHSPTDAARLQAVSSAPFGGGGGPAPSGGGSGGASMTATAAGGGSSSGSAVGGGGRGTHLGCSGGFLTVATLQAALELLLQEDLEQRVLPFDAAAAAEAASLAAKRQRAGRPVDMRDTQIAGIALACRASIATRNVRHFDDLSVAVFDPWQSASE